MRKLLLPLLFLGVIGCQPYSESYELQQRTRDGYSPSQSRYDADEQCTFQTRRGPVAGYKRSGKDRCCVDTRNGPSCQ